MSPGSPEILQAAMVLYHLSSERATRGPVLYYFGPLAHEIITGYLKKASYLWCVLFYELKSCPTKTIANPRKNTNKIHLFNKLLLSPYYVQVQFQARGDIKG